MNEQLKYVKEIKGDVFKSGADIICHQVNYAGVMGAGIARTIRDEHLSKERFAEYKAVCKAAEREKEGSASLLGSVLFSKSLSGSYYIANCFGQDGQTTDYDALKESLTRVADTAKAMGKTVALPGYIGCDLAGGDWNIVRNQIIIPIFEEKGVELTIVYFG